MPYPLGGVVPLDVAIVDAAGHPVDPTTITITITKPDDTVDTPTPSSTQTGRWTVDYVPTMAGLHNVLWTTTGPALAYPDVVDVRASAPGYIVSLADARKKCKIPANKTDHDDRLRGYMESVTNGIEDHLHEAIIRRTVVEDIRADWVDEVQLSTTPVLALIGATRIDGTRTWDPTELHVDARTGVVACLPGVQLLNGLVRFTTRVGYTAIPAHWVEAAKIIIEQLWFTERPSSRGAPNSGGYEDSMHTTFSGSFGYAIPNRALELLGKPPVIGG